MGQLFSLFNKKKSSTKSTTTTTKLPTRAQAYLAKSVDENNYDYDENDDDNKTPNSNDK